MQNVGINRGNLTLTGELYQLSLSLSMYGTMLDVGNLE